MRIAVMALQGAFIEHVQRLKELGADTCEIRQLADWKQFLSATDGGGRGVVLPGGESTVQALLMQSLGLSVPLREAIVGGMPVFATCAGMILLADTHLSTMQIRVRRNAFGRQLGSFRTTGTVEGIGTDIPMTFIRAPYIEEVNDTTMCQPLAHIEGHIVAARQQWQLGTAFHPELDADKRLHSYFMRMVGEAHY